MTFIPLIGASDTTIAFGVSLALYLLLAGPVVAVCFAVRGKETDAIERAVTDVERFIELRKRAHAELAATGSLDRFIEIKDEARKHLWPASEHAQLQRRSTKRECPPVSQNVRAGVFAVRRIELLGKEN
jgi:hypothetical protein